MQKFLVRVKTYGPFVFDLLVSIVVVITTWSSGQTAAVSGGASRGIVSWFLSYLPGGYTQDTVALLDHLFRKAAHFTLYFILGFSLTGCFQRQSRVPPALVALLTGAVFAGLDEFHQIFVDGRGPSLSDVFLDTCGVAAGCLLRTVLHKVRTCIHSRKCRMGERFCRRTRQIFAGILCVWQENLTKYGGKRSAQTAY